MKATDFRRIALSLEAAVEGSHMGVSEFRVGGRTFATLASEDQGYGTLMLTPEQQAEFVRKLPEVFLPMHGGWGRMGMTRIRLAQANEDVLAGPLRTARMKATLTRTVLAPRHLAGVSVGRCRSVPGLARNARPEHRCDVEYRTATHHLRTTQVDPEPLFAGQVTQIGTELDDLARLFFHGMVNSIDNGIRLCLSKSFFEHVAEGLHVGLLLEVCPIFAGQG